MVMKQGPDYCSFHAPQKSGVSVYVQTVDTRPFFRAWVQGYKIHYVVRDYGQLPNCECR